jgi:hypothetical protein
VIGTAPVPQSVCAVEEYRDRAVSHTATAADGYYEFPKTAPGKYELNINLAGMQSYRQTGSTVESGGLHLDAKLEDGPSLRTLGEDPAAIPTVFLNRPAPPWGPDTTDSP